MKASEGLRNALAALDGGTRWAGGRKMGVFCSSTAISFGACPVNRELELQIKVLLLRAIRCTDFDPLRPSPSIWRWNDAPERTFADVEAAFQKAIALAEAEGN